MAQLCVVQDIRVDQCLHGKDNERQQCTKTLSAKIQAKQIKVWK